MKDPDLALWVTAQRRYQKSLRMPNDRVKRLTEIGFRWSTSNQDRWMMRFHDLRRFASMHGHCNVPLHCRDFPRLRSWVFNQRTQYRYLKRGLKSSLKKEQIDLLNSLGFKWNKKPINNATNNDLMNDKAVSDNKAKDDTYRFDKQSSHRNGVCANPPINSDESNYHLHLQHSIHRRKSDCGNTPWFKSTMFEDLRSKKARQLLEHLIDC